MKIASNVSWNLMISPYTYNLKNYLQYKYFLLIL